MNNAAYHHVARSAIFARRLWSDHRVWLATVAILAGVTLIDPSQGAESLGFAAEALMKTAPYLLLSIGLAAYAGKSRVFVLYIALALSGSLASGLLFQVWVGS